MLAEILTALVTGYLIQTQERLLKSLSVLHDRVSHLEATRCCDRHCDHDERGA